MIARRSYAYYEAAANILREENEGDMTYFLEYYLDLLSRAIDERRLRLQNTENEARQAEIEMARTALSPPSHTGPPGNLTAARKAEINNEENSFPDGFYTVSTNESEQSYDDSNIGDIGLGRIRDKLNDIVNGRGKTSKKCAMVLINLFDNGIYSFTSKDIAKRCDASRKMISVFIWAPLKI